VAPLIESFTAGNARFRGLIDACLENLLALSPHDAGELLKGASASSKSVMLSSPSAELFADDAEDEQGDDRGDHEAFNDC
jgi:hypothetical protein